MPCTISLKLGWETLSALICKHQKKKRKKKFVRLGMPKFFVEHKFKIFKIRKGYKLQYLVLYRDDTSYNLYDSTGSTNDISFDSSHKHRFKGSWLIMEGMRSTTN
uniref:Putative ovule protein n=1 Tax=Solanum chacoense TaxID=4108 RepID=A0A0V0IZV5_SOLCH